MVPQGLSKLTEENIKSQSNSNKNKKNNNTSITSNSCYILIYKVY